MSFAHLTDDSFDEPRTVLERAKGALMLQFGISSYQAFALLLSWARVQDRPVPEIARVLVLGVVEEDPATLAANAPLVAWLEARLTSDLVDAVDGTPQTSGTWHRPGTDQRTGGTARGRRSRS